ncbi:hypothetical protein THASP1DRAFT_27448 [Thamnocephalis sphaerospora]|uniref:Uncharacterized protein n=1 Tax=Thamnocephalis sphaerospora TaxID=78915 RepID=A0A4P9XWU3_9FUNG|nr:hypothetical protein THASP1DRAFT_27448 [Thamnocephalis sphaerospora]|eukprot:RKP10796.1 hypothetical protein THASP1DRAFT_27448 [Thamnocephalis sphaerospora]
MAEDAKAQELAYKAAYDFVQEGEDIKVIHQRLAGNGMQLAICTCVVYLFIRNIIRTTMILRYKRSITHIFCLLQALFGMIFTITSMVYQTFPSGPSCRTVILVGMVMLHLSNMCLHGILLFKAYVVRQRSRSFLLGGTLVMLCTGQPASLGILVGLAPAVLYSDGVCTLAWPSWFPIFKFIVDVSINMALSYAFLAVVLRQWRQFGAGSWSFLLKEGIQYMLATTLCNIICVILIVTYVAGHLTVMFYIVEWALTSTLMVQHVCNGRAARRAKDSSLNSNSARTPMTPLTPRSPGSPAPPVIVTPAEVPSFGERLFFRILTFIAPPKSPGYDLPLSPAIPESPNLMPHSKSLKQQKASPSALLSPPSFMLYPSPPSSADLLPSPRSQTFAFPGIAAAARAHHQQYYDLAPPHEDESESDDGEDINGRDALQRVDSLS